jgi:hypothetical protein
MTKELPIMERKINRLQTVFSLIINVLKNIPLAIPLANKQTLMRWFAKFRLQIQNIIRLFANEKTLISNGFSAYRLRHRLQSCQLSPLTSLQAQVVSFAVCKEQTKENQSIHPNIFASFFANNPN